MPMKIYRSLEEVPDIPQLALTIGTFDGVHLGHREILNRLNKAARQNNGSSMLLTFWPHPRMVLQPDDDSLKLLNTIDEKIALLAACGIDHLLILPFTREFSRLPYLQFVRDILVNRLNMKYLVVGHDHHFGKNREGSYEQLVECAPLYGFGLERVEAHKENDVAVSSSKIRHALQEADTEKANKYLGTAYELSGTVIHGAKRGRLLGYPTANIYLSDSYKLIPALGVYIAQASVGGVMYDAMVNIGHNPTFEDKATISIEANIFEFNREIYGEKITLKFLKYLRKEVKFASIQSLIEQMDRDKEETLLYFENQ